MEVVLDRRRALRVGLALVVVRLLGGCGGATGMIPPTGRPRAEALAAALADHLGATPGRVPDRGPDRRLGDDDDVAFGDVGLHHDTRADTLYVRVFVAPADIEDAPPHELANMRRVAQALNDPTIGGMFDRADGYFVLDEAREAYFLVKPISVTGTDQRRLIGAVERMRTVAARWTTRWFYRVAMIVGGHQPRPTRPGTLADPE
jgi:hypothetical protein